MTSKKQPRIGLVMTSNFLHKNEYIFRLLKNHGENIPVLFQLSFKHPKKSFKDHTLVYVKLLGLKGMIYLAWKKFTMTISGLFNSIIGKPNLTSLKSICQSTGTELIEIESVNSPKFRDLIDNHEIDYIINSGNQIYGTKTIKHLKYRILNRHTSYLPSYGGIYPVFWQMLHGVPEGGVTIHWINELIDDGEIAYQKNFDLKNSLFENYKIAFDVSYNLCSQAVEDLKQGTEVRKPMEGEKSYYSWPKESDIKEFKKKGNRIV